MSISLMKDGIARIRAIPSCMTPSSTRYGVRDAKVVGLNTTSVVLDSYIVKADITYAMSVFLMHSPSLSLSLSISSLLAPIISSESWLQLRRTRVEELELLI